MCIIRNHLHMQSYNVRRNVLDISSVVMLLFVCGWLAMYLAIWLSGWPCLTAAAVNMAVRALKFGMSTPLMIIWKTVSQFFFFYLLSYAPFSIFPYIFVVILMQYYGKTENDRTIRSCIRVYIQKVKKYLKSVSKKIIFEELWPLGFLGFHILYQQ